MNEALVQLLKEGGALAALVLVYLIVRLLIPLFQHKPNGKDAAAIVLIQKRLDDLEKATEKLEGYRHNVIMPALRWHDAEIERLGGKRSRSLIP